MSVETTQRAGFVAIVGPPNVGKSTLLNALIGEHLTAVSAKAQTTRTAFRGILTRDGTQLVLVDTPGLLDPSGPLQEALLDAAHGAIEGVDAAYVLADEPRVTDPERTVLQALRADGIPALLVVTKGDRLEPGRVEAILDAWRDAFEWSGVHVVSAMTRRGLDDLIDATAEIVPEQPFFFAEDDLTDASVRGVAAELVREACYQKLGEEVPYSVHVVVDEWHEPSARNPKTRIRATIFVEKESQKGIVIGAGGKKLKAIGMQARQAIELLIGGPVHLALWVKVRKKWTRNDRDLKFFGYRK